MRPLIWVLLFLFSGFSYALDSLKPQWKILRSLQDPESAYYDPEKQVIYVSNIAGEGTAKDNIGWIARLSPNGVILEEKWLDGFHAPKGMRSREKTLWVTNIDQLVEIFTDGPKVVRRIKVPDAKFLNDVAICPDETVYVSDMLTGKIHRLLAGKEETEVFLTEKDLPNGLFCDGKKLWVTGWGEDIAPDFSTKVPGSFYSIDLVTKKKEILISKLGNLDGLEPIGGGEWMISDWVAGKVYRVDKNMKAKLFLESLKGSADIGWVPDTRTLLVPEMKTHLLKAYKVP